MRASRHKKGKTTLKQHSWIHAHYIYDLYYFRTRMKRKSINPWQAERLQMLLKGFEHFESNSKGSHRKISG